MRWHSGFRGVQFWRDSVSMRVPVGANLVFVPYQSEYEFGERGEHKVRPYCPSLKVKGR
jgi:hypothetical protein